MEPNIRQIFKDLVKFKVAICLYCVKVLVNPWYQKKDFLIKRESSSTWMDCYKWIWMSSKYSIGLFEYIFFFFETLFLRNCVCNGCYMTGTGCIRWECVTFRDGVTQSCHVSRYVSIKILHWFSTYTETLIHVHGNRLSSNKPFPITVIFSCKHFLEKRLQMCINLLAQFNQFKLSKNPVNVLKLTTK